MPERKTKLGLVLSGGGAKGAYEVGVIRALAEYGIEPQVVSGASIGAINGSIVASSSDIAQAAAELEMIWRGIDQNSTIKTGLSAKKIISLASLHLVISKCLQINPSSFGFSLAVKYLRDRLQDDDNKVLSLLDSSPLEEILKEHIDFSCLQSSARAFYVSLFPAGSGVDGPSFWTSVTKYMTSSGLSEFKYVNDQPLETITKLVMASAAIPFAFKPIKIDGTWYYDGGMGDRVRVQGNTPVKPLIDNQCTHAIIVVLGNGVLWDRSEWEQITPIEIRPSCDMSGLFAVLNFDPSRIDELIEIGYHDANRAMGRVFDALGRVSSLRTSSKRLTEEVSSLTAQKTEYDSVMARIRGICNN